MWARLFALVRIRWRPLPAFKVDRDDPMSAQGKLVFECRLGEMPTKHTQIPNGVAPSDIGPSLWGFVKPNYSGEAEEFSLKVAASTDTRGRWRAFKEIDHPPGPKNKNRRPIPAA